MRIAFSLAAAAVAVSLSAVPAPTAAADTVPAVPHELSSKLHGGRAVVLGQRSETVRRVDTGSMLAREALVSNEAYATLTGSGARLKEATLTMGYQVGCAVAVTSIVAGVQGLASLFGVDANPAGGDKSSVTVRPKKGGAKNKPDKPATSEQSDDDNALETTVKVYPGMQLGPGVEVALAMGSVVDIPLATGPVRNSRALIGVQESSVRIDGCLGPAAIRSYATLTTKSALADDTIVVYGDPVPL
ncbi:MspA family porin [Nocardia blacklockiae]|uniref:MspA family porin n=1 Tax=Nocardia blacklockiae TaxID=480036 RepID=UPI00189576B2|nr:MspA family porin [Nocardia blacklockiae]MBF6171642.1 MspA family porin [Nocardia blacklockiae]